MDPHPITDEEAVAAADKEMEARANRAKELLSQRYVGLKRQQVCGRRVDDETSVVVYTVGGFMADQRVFFMCYQPCRSRRIARVERCSSSVKWWGCQKIRNRCFVVV